MIGFGVGKSKGTCRVSQDKAVPKGFLGCLQSPGTWVVVKIMVPFWVP